MSVTWSFAKKLGIHQHSFTSPYHPQTNGLAENTNKSITRSLQKLVDDTGRNWEEFLGDILFAIKTKHNNQNVTLSTTYGFEATFPDQVSDNYMPTDSEELSEEHYAECSLRLKCRNDADIELAFSNISKAQEKPQI
ncbi:unnamed protein product [Eretmochelys imbricata]